MSCELCHLPYDRETRSPKVMFCGHTCCEECVVKIFESTGYFKCPWDRQPDLRCLEEIQTNMALVEAAFLDQHAYARARGINIETGLWLDERELQLSDREIGRGATGRVVEGTYKERPVAVKLIDVSSVPNDVSKSLQNEVAVHLHLSRSGARHHTCQYMGVTIKNSNFCLVMRKYDKNLATLIAESWQGASGGLPMHKILNYSSQALASLAELHGQKIVMVDLKPQNLLYDSRLDELVVTDFGLSKIVNTTTGAFRPSTIQGTFNYMSPEQMNPGASVTFATDMWSWACTVIQMATGRVPFAELNPIQINNKVFHNRERPEIPAHLPANLRHLLQRCLSHNPRERPSVIQALEALGEVIHSSNQCVVSPKAQPNAHGTRAATTQAVSSRSTMLRSEAPSSLAGPAAGSSARSSSSSLSIQSSSANRVPPAPASPVAPRRLQMRLVSGSSSPSCSTADSSRSAGINTSDFVGTGGSFFRKISPESYTTECLTAPRSRSTRPAVTRSSSSSSSGSEYVDVRGSCSTRSYTTECFSAPRSRSTTSAVTSCSSREYYPHDVGVRGSCSTRSCTTECFTTPRSRTTSSSVREYLHVGGSSSSKSYTTQVQTGPRGGKYYVNANGNKSYLRGGQKSRTYWD